MNEEVKMLDNIFRFLQKTPIEGSDSELMTQAKQYLVARIQEIQNPPPQQTEE